MRSRYRIVFDPNFNVCPYRIQGRFFWFWWQDLYDAGFQTEKEARDELEKWINPPFPVTILHEV